MGWEKYEMQINFLKNNGLIKTSELLFYPPGLVVYKSLRESPFMIHCAYGMMRDEILEEINHVFRTIPLSNFNVLIKKIGLWLEDKHVQMENLNRQYHNAAFDFDQYLKKKDSSTVKFYDDFYNHFSEPLGTLQYLILNVEAESIKENIQLFEEIDADFDLVQGEAFRFFEIFKMFFLEELTEAIVEAINEILDGLGLYGVTIKNTASDKNSINYSTLKDIFKDESEFEEMLDVLRSAYPPVISQKNIYLLGDRKKSSIVAFFDVLRRRNKIKTGVSDKSLIPLIENSLQVSISARTFRKRTEVYNEYVEFFKLEID